MAQLLKTCPDQFPSPTFNYVAKSNSSTSPFHPTNALIYLGIGVIRLLSMLPFHFQLALGKAIGTLMACLFPYRKQVGLTNLRLCFPQKSDREHRILLKAHYQSLGMALFETAVAWFRPYSFFEKITEIEGLEHIDAVKKSHRGALLISGHFTTLEVVGRCALSQFPFSCLYRKPDQPVLAKIMVKSRNRWMKHVIHHDDMKALLRAVKDKELIWYAPDQGKKIVHSSLVPFFGVPAVTNTVTTRLAQKANAAIIPFTGFRKPDGTYKVVIGPEVTELPTDDPVADALVINQIIESFIKNAPEQYFWLHKRFKNRGEDLPDVYAEE